MKKTTILIYKDMSDPKKGLREATQEEWSAILRDNKGLPMCERRCFMEDSFEDCGVMDRMFIEVSHEEYQEWSRQRKKKQRHTEGESQYLHLSLDNEKDELKLVDGIADGFDLEENVVADEMVKNYIEALRKWKPWGIEFLKIYSEHGRNVSTKFLMKKYGLTRRGIAKRKEELDYFTKIFFKC